MPLQWASLKQICILNLFVSLKFDWILYFTWLAKHQSGGCTATSWIFAQPFRLSCYSHNIASHLNRHAGLYVICLHGMIIIYVQWFLFFRFPFTRIHSSCQHTTQPLPFNKGCRPNLKWFQVGRSIGGYIGHSRGDPWDLPGMWGHKPSLHLLRAKDCRHFLGPNVIVYNPLHTLQHHHWHLAKIIPIVYPCRSILQLSLHCTGTLCHSSSHW